MDRNLSGATTPGQRGSGINGNEKIPCIPQSSSMTGASPSDFRITIRLYNTPTASLQRSKSPSMRVLDMTLNYLMVETPVILKLWGTEYPFIAIAPRSTLARDGSTCSGPIYGSEITKLCTYTRLNCLK